MSQLTDDFIFQLIVSGKTKKEASFILSDIFYHSILELYKEKNLSIAEEKELDSKLKKYIVSKDKKNIFRLLNITPQNLEQRLSINFSKYFQNYASS